MNGDSAQRGAHDLGGVPAGAVARDAHDYALWEKRVDALMVLLSNKQHMRVDELRRNIESLGAQAYERMSYYERWVYAIAQTLIQRGLVTIDELGRRMVEVEAREYHAGK